jgi:hypothetical protein
MVYRNTPAVKFVSDAAVSVTGKLFDNGFDLGDEFRIIPGRVL